MATGPTGASTSTPAGAGPHPSQVSHPKKRARTEALQAQAQAQAQAQLQGAAHLGGGLMGPSDDEKLSAAAAAAAAAVLAASCRAGVAHTTSTIASNAPAAQFDPRVLQLPVMFGGFPAVFRPEYGTMGWQSGAPATSGMDPSASYTMAWVQSPPVDAETRAAAMQLAEMDSAAAAAASYPGAYFSGVDAYGRPYGAAGQGGNHNAGYGGNFLSGPMAMFAAVGGGAARPAVSSSATSGGVNPALRAAASSMLGVSPASVNTRPIVSLVPPSGVMPVIPQTMAAMTSTSPAMAAAGAAAAAIGNKPELGRTPLSVLLRLAQDPNLPSSPQSPHHRRRFTVEQKRLVCKFAVQCSSQKEALQMLQQCDPPVRLNQSTLSQWIHQYRRGALDSVVDSQWAVGKAGRTGQHPLDPAFEDVLFSRLVVLRAQNRPLSFTQVTELARELCNHPAFNNSRIKSCKFSSGWVSNFARRKFMGRPRRPMRAPASPTDESAITDAVSEWCGMMTTITTSPRFCDTGLVLAFSETSFTCRGIGAALTDGHDGAYFRPSDDASDNHSSGAEDHDDDDTDVDADAKDGHRERSVNSASKRSVTIAMTVASTGTPLPPIFVLKGDTDSLLQCVNEQMHTLGVSLSSQAAMTLSAPVIINVPGAASRAAGVPATASASPDALPVTAEIAMSADSKTESATTPTTSTSATSSTETGSTSTTTPAATAPTLLGAPGSVPASAVAGAAGAAAVDPRMLAASAVAGAWSEIDGGVFVRPAPDPSHPAASGASAWLHTYGSTQYLTCRNGSLVVASGSGWLTAPLMELYVDRVVLPWVAQHRMRLGDMNAPVLFVTDSYAAHTSDQMASLMAGSRVTVRVLPRVATAKLSLADTNLNGHLSEVIGARYSMFVESRMTRHTEDIRSGASNGEFYTPAPTHLAMVGWLSAALQTMPSARVQSAFASWDPRSRRAGHSRPVVPIADALADIDPRFKLDSITQGSWDDDEDDAGLKRKRGGIEASSEEFSKCLLKLPLADVFRMCGVQCESGSDRCQA